MKTKLSNMKWKAALLIVATLAVTIPQGHAQQPAGQAARQEQRKQSDKYTTGDDFLIDPKEAEQERTFVNAASSILKDSLARLSRWSYDEAKTKLSYELKRAIDAGDEDEKTLMKTALRHGLDIKSWLGEDTYPNAPGLIDATVRVLWRSAKFAQYYAEFDKRYLDAQLASKPDVNTALPTAEFGLRFNRFVMELDDSIVPAKTQFRVAFAAVGWLHKDIKADPLQNYLAETKAKLAETQIAMQPFYYKMIKTPEQIKPREYIAATKELRWGLELALKAIPNNFPQPWQNAGVDKLLYE
jgi:hypothetical protein